MCRHELATDDKDYEEFKRQKVSFEAWPLIQYKEVILPV